MTNTLPAKPSLSLLKKQAKKLLKQVREGNTRALALVESNHPNPSAFTGLRDAQLVIARSYGFPGWVELGDAVEVATDAEKNLAEKAHLFIQLGCVQYSGNDTVRNYQRARRLLDNSPEIAEFSFYTALVANNASVVSECLESNPSLAMTAGGPLDWPPLLYVTYSRIDEADGTQHSVAIVRQLLQSGASPDSHVMLDDSYRFTALTGAMGEGEQGVNQPPHQYADEIAALLLEAGANPNEGQGLYNTMFSNSADKWLALLLNKGLSASDPLNWNNADSNDADDDADNDADNNVDPDSSNNAKVATLDYQLSNAVDSNRPARVALLLNAGANPNACNTYNGRAIHTNALLAGHTAIAQSLQERGAIAETLDLSDQFRLACVNDDTDTIATLLAADPVLKEDTSLLHAAAEHASVRVLKTLITSGFDVNGQSKHGRTLLHHFALSNDTSTINDLLCLGARTDILDYSHQSSAAGFAAYSGCYDAMRLLLDQSDSLLDVVCCAYLERAQAIVEALPDSIHHTTEKGNTALHIIGVWLHDEPEHASYKSIIEWLLSVGADINAQNKQGQTPEQFNLAIGSETLAELLSDYR